MVVYAHLNLSAASAQPIGVLGRYRHTWNAEAAGKESVHQY